MHGQLPNSLYELAGGSCSESCNFLQDILGATSSEDHRVAFSDVDHTLSVAEAKAVAANKSHSEAERRRRKRINGHLATLRNLVPKTIKGDKASLLAEVVRCMRELKKTTEEFSSSAPVDECNASSSAKDKLLFPGETDELQICRVHGNPSIIKASVCCEDRSQMMTELTKALKQIAKVVRAEMATVGGRTKTVLWLQVSGEGEGEGEEEGMVATIRKAIKGVVDNRINMPGMILPGHGQSLLGNKRPRLYHA